MSSSTIALKAATQLAIGAEETPGGGSGDAITRRLVTKVATYREVEEREQFEGAMSGSLARVTQAPVITRRRTELELPMEFNFEQVLLPLLAGVDGSVSPTTPGTGAARLWTFNCDPQVVKDPQTLGLEWVESNFAASPTNAARKAAYCFCTAFEVKGADSGLPMVTCSFVARAAEATTKTALDLPELTYFPNAGWSIYIDETWAGLGGTHITGQIYGFTYKFSGYLRPGYYLDNRAVPDLSCHDFGARVAEFTLDMVLDPTEAYATELAAKEAGDLRFVRAGIIGPAFSAPDAAFSQFFKIDGAYFHAPDSLAEHGKDRDGNAIVTVHLLSALDPVSGKDIRFIVQNAVDDFFAEES